MIDLLGYWLGYGALIIPMFLLIFGLTAEYFHNQLKEVSGDRYTSPLKKWHDVFWCRSGSGYGSSYDWGSRWYMWVVMVLAVAQMVFVVVLGILSAIHGTGPHSPRHIENGCDFTGYSDWLIEFNHSIASACAPVVGWLGILWLCTFGLKKLLRVVFNVYYRTMDAINKAEQDE